MATQTMTRHRSQTTIRTRTVLRLILGLIFFVMGLNGFFSFLPMPEMSGKAATFMGALSSAGYFFPLLKVIETVSGICLLINWSPHIALMALLPITVNIFLFHAFLAPSGIFIGSVVFLFNVILIGLYIDKYKPLLESGNQK